MEANQRLHVGICPAANPIASHGKRPDVIHLNGPQLIRLPVSGHASSLSWLPVAWAVRRELRLPTGAGQVFAPPFPFNGKTVEAVPFPHVTWAHAWSSPLRLCQSMSFPSASTPPIDLRRPTTARTKRRTSTLLDAVPAGHNLSRAPFPGSLAGGSSLSPRLCPDPTSC